MYIKKEMSFEKFRDIANYLYEKSLVSNCNMYDRVFNNEWALYSMYEYVDESFSILDKHIEDTMGVVGRPIGDFTTCYQGYGRLITLADLQPANESRVLWLFDYFEFHQSNLSYETDIIECGLKQVAVLNKKDYSYTLFRNNKALPTEQGMQHNTTKQGN